MSRDLARIIVRQYPPRRDGLWNPDLFKRTIAQRQDSGTAALTMRCEIATPTLPQRLWSNEDVRHFTMTFLFAFVGLMIFFA